VRAARERQLVRQGKPNAWLQARETTRHCAIDGDAENLLKQAIARLSLSARGYHRVLRVARSIADLEPGDAIASAHVAEAIQYRRMDVGF
jgi:magnesium chelatase family protein